MNTHRYDEARRREWVRDKMNGVKTVKQICKEASISRATLYNWLEEFADFSENEKDSASKQGIVLQRYATENGEQFKMLVAALATVDTDKSFSKKIVAALIKRFTLTPAQACAVVGIDEETYGYKPRKPEVEDYIVYEALVQLIHHDRKRDFDTCLQLLLQSNPEWTRKQIKRVYRDGMVYLERERANTRWEKAGKAKKKSTSETSAPKSVTDKKYIQIAGGIWHLVLVEGSGIFDAAQKNWWILCMFDEETSFHLNAAAGFGIITTEDILSFLDRVATENGFARKLQLAGKPELSAREITRWVWQHKMALQTLSLAKPENATSARVAEEKILSELSMSNINSEQAFQECIVHWIQEATNA
ncbi:MAG: transposase [Bacteroidetes bacterium]|nr:transposase [Bacteroidota bacterium]